MTYMNRSWKPANYTTYELAQIAQAEQDQENEATALYERDEQRRLDIHPAYRLMANQMETTNGEFPTNEEATALVLGKVAKTGQRVTDQAVKEELRGIYRDIRSRGGDAYGEHKIRLQQLAK